MSRLSRFKKAPSLKLPPKPNGSRGRFDDSDDDDFVKQPMPVARKSPRYASKRSGETNSSSGTLAVGSGNKVPVVNASTSEYFASSAHTCMQPTCSIDTENRNSNTSTDQAKQDGETAESSHSSSGKHKKDNKNVPGSGPKEKISLLSPSSNEPMEEVGSKVLCPFCWKKLGDKLSGTTHVKSCAKDLSINRVFEAIQLQEKQIQEWEKLGLAFPGFSNSNANKKASKAPPPGGKADRRKKKVNDVVGDPQLEMAIALSESLHEEVKNRKMKENQFIIENGLEKEIELAVTADAVCSKGINCATEGNSRTAEPLRHANVNAGGRRRGKKLDTKHLPLFTTDLMQKKTIIGERVTRILEESEIQVQSFYIRDELPSVGVPKSLKSVVNEHAPLWHLAQNTENASDKSFSTLELKLPPEALERSDSSDVPGTLQDLNNILPQKRKTEEKAEEQRKRDSDATDARQLLEKGEEAKGSGSFVVRSIKAESTHSSRKPSSVLVSPCSDIHVINNSSSRRERAGKNNNKSTTSVKSSIPSFEKLSPVIRDIAKMFLDKKGDIVVYGREEKPIRCHRFMLSARCPLLLNEIIIETNNEQASRDIIPLTDYDHNSVKAFLWYIYTGCIETCETKIRDDLKKIGETFGMEIKESANSPNSSNDFITAGNVSSKEVQTDMKWTQESSTMTEEFFSCQLTEGFNKTSQELFASFEKEPDHGSPSNRQLCSPQSSISDVPLDDYNYDDDTRSSKDLFEESDNGLDLENDVNEEKLPENVEGHLNAPLPSGEPEKTVVRASDDNDCEDEYLKELATPVSYDTSSMLSDKKRSRSASPAPFTFDDDDDLYTATQVADMMYHNNGSGRNQYIKANKKQKLDGSIKKLNQFDINLEVADSFSFYDKCNTDNISVIDTHKADRERQPVNLDSPVSVYSNSRNLFLSRRSASSPSLATHNNDSPFLPQQNYDHVDTEYDPFADACDDSIFAKIPDFLSSSNKGSVSGTSNKNNLNSISFASDVHSKSPQTHKIPLPRKLSMSPPISDCDDSASGKRKKGRQRGKAKPPAPPKIKLPASKTVSQQDQSTNLPSTCTLGNQHSVNSRSPMLNYSLIDTPVLKQELKKFGIKPLPRSKAKVLLRHIYKETHNT